MLFNLVRKDFIIAKKYLVFQFIFAIVGPLFISSKLEFTDGGLISFLVTALFSVYILFNSVSTSEDKYKGSALLCATPYTRSSLVKAKYLFILVIFICSAILYTITASILPESLERLNVASVGITLLIITIFFAILIPVQFKFGFEKTKYIAFMVVFITPFIFPSIVSGLESNEIKIQVQLPFPQMIQEWIPYVIALLISFISVRLSIRIYSKKNL